MIKNSVKICAVSPKITLGNVSKNLDTALYEIDCAAKRGVEILLFPELVLTGATAGDLFFRGDILNAADDAAQRISEFSHEKAIVSAVGFPISDDGRIYNTVKLTDGDDAYYASKSNLSGVGSLNQARWFSEGAPSEVVETNTGVKIAVLHYADLPRAEELATQGAELILIPSAIPKTAGIADAVKRRLLALSEKLSVAVLFCNASYGESVTDYLYDGGLLIASRGKILAESTTGGRVEAELDLQAIRRGKKEKSVAEDTVLIEESISEACAPLKKFPFISTNFVAQATEVFEIQSEALKRRLEHVRAKKAILGVSGGLDSTLALLVSVEAMRRAGRSAKDVLAVTMPGSGTSGRTYENAKRLMRLLEVEQREISIEKAFLGHLRDLNHQGEADVAYENAQARERTQILMDLANMESGIVVGTGDLSELATGFATYNGDHMSMYGVNGSVPKTLMREMVKFFAERTGGELEEVLKDIVSTPVSPELKPTVEGKTSQFSELVVGPYELVDFFLYYFHFRGFTAEELHRAAAEVYGDRYTAEELTHWQNAFVKRFFASQFKRSCMPDGIDATGFSFSPRGGLVLPSDLFSEQFLLK